MRLIRILKYDLCREVAAWVGAEIISTEQAESIWARYGVDYHNLSRRSFAYHVLVGFGCLFIGLSLMTLVGANWDGIPRAIRMAGLIAFTLGANLAGLAQFKREKPSAAVVWFFLGGLFYGVSIMLIAQIYNIGDRFVKVYRSCWGLYRCFGAVCHPRCDSPAGCQILEKPSCQSGGLIMSKKTITKGLAVIIVLQITVLAGEYLSAIYPLWLGREIRLKTVPVDPRSLFRGNYARLSYGISTIDGKNLGGNKKPRNGEIVYVKLRHGTDGLSVFDGVSLKKPGYGPFIRGRIQKRRSQDNSQVYDVRYGIEAYFAPRKKALALEKNCGTAVWQSS